MRYNVVHVLISNINEIHALDDALGVRTISCHKGIRYSAIPSCRGLGLDKKILVYTGVPGAYGDGVYN